jgi:hypothetical protein
MQRLRVVCFHIQSSEGGGPRLCRLRIDRLDPANKINYVLTHIRFMGSRKLSSFDSRWVGRQPTVLNRWHWNSVGPPTDAHRGITWKNCTRVWWTRLNSLIVVLNCGYSWCLCSSRVSCCQVITLQGYIDANLCDTHEYGWCLFAAVIP